MIKIEPFKGLRYKFHNLSNLICPPYDVIDKDLKNKLLSYSKYNFVRIELPSSLKTTNQLMKSFIKNGILKYEKNEAFYIHEHKFLITKEEYKTRLGLICLLNLNSEVIKHEQTKEEPIKERFEHITTLKMNSSPIFCIVSDGKFYNLLTKITKKVYPQLGFTSTEPEGDKSEHRIWIIADEKSITEIKKNISNKELIIADGHHRFEASYRAYKSGESEFILSYISSSDDPGLLILPTYRVVYYGTEIKEKMKKYFKLSPWNGKSKINLACYFDNSFHILNSKERDLPIIILHKFLLDNIPPEAIFYTKDIQTAIKKAQEINGIAFFLNSLSFDDILNAIKSKKILPPKSTYFYPKVPVGLVMYKWK